MNLLITPKVIKVGEKVMISINATNTVDMVGKFTISLKVNGTIEATKELILSGKESKEVKFEVRKYVPGTYYVKVNELTGTFVVRAPKPAKFIVTDLSIIPTEAEVKQKITVSVKVTNTGEQNGSYTLNLKVNDKIVDTKTVTLTEGESRTVTFELTEEKAGTFNVEVAGLKGAFIVKEVPPPPLWGLYTIIAAVTVIAIGMITIIYRKRHIPHSSKSLH